MLDEPVAVEGALAAERAANGAVVLVDRLFQTAPAKGVGALEAAWSGHDVHADCAFQLAVQAVVGEREAVHVVQQGSRECTQRRRVHTTPGRQILGIQADRARGG